MSPYELQPKFLELTVLHITWKHVFIYSVCCGLMALPCLLQTGINWKSEPMTEKQIFVFRCDERAELGEPDSRRHVTEHLFLSACVRFDSRGTQMPLEIDVTDESVWAGAICWLLSTTDLWKPGQPGSTVRLTSFLPALLWRPC